MKGKSILKKWWFWLLIVFTIGGIATFLDDEAPTKDTTNSVPATKKTEQKEHLSLEEQSKQFLEKNAGPNNDINHLIEAYMSVKDDELKQMIAIGHAKGTQMSDDFDVIGAEISATGEVINFENIYYNTYSNRGKKNGVKTETRTDFFVMYTGDKPIDDYEYIEYDSTLHKDRDKNEFFLGVYPEEINHLILVDLDTDQDINLGQQITVQGRIKNFVIAEDFNNNNEQSSINIDMAKVIE